MLGSAGAAHGTVSAVSAITCTPVPNTTDTPGSTCTAQVTYTPIANFNGSDTFEFAVRDGGLQSAPASVAITVNAVNDAPVAVGQSVATAEDTPKTVTVSASDVDSTAISFSIVSAPSHGTLGAIGAASCTPSANGSGTPGATCTAQVTYTPDANYNGSDNFTFKGSDGSLDSTGASVAITVMPVNDPPVAASQSVSTLEDTPLMVALNASDIDSTSLAFMVVGGPVHGTLGPVTVSCTASTNGTGTPGSNCTAQVAYAPAQDYNGSDAFTFKVNDGALDSNVATVAIGITPVNDPPANVAVGVTPAVINEGDATTLSGSFTDPDVGDPHTVTINWGDGSPNTTLTLAAGIFTFSASHTYVDDSPTATAADVKAIGVMVTDRAGTSGGSATSVTVNNVAPVITSVNVPLDPIAVNGSITAVVNFQDIGSQDTHGCTFHWNDGTPDTTVTGSTGSGSCSATHKYTVSNVYQVDVTVADDDLGDTTSYYQYVVVYDPSNGFVTGGGWINSPAGAYAANPALAGKANFGFVSKYQKGANVPTGNTEFQFQAGNFNFKSTVYEWLVISGAKAQYKGSGTINGAGDYGFMLTGIDGSVSGGGGTDKFRLKVWDKATSAVIYDNQVGAVDTADPTTVLGGGSIVIHK
jgi:cadherin-like protein